MKKNGLIKVMNVSWSDYGVVVSIKPFNNRYKNVHVLTKNGKWSGLSESNNCFVTLFSQSKCDWNGKNTDSLGYWTFSNIIHEQNFTQYSTSIKINNIKHYEASLSCLVICELIQKYVPERVMCLQTWNAFLISKQFLAEGKAIKAWINFESFLSGISCDQIDEIKNISKFITESLCSLNTQYQIDSKLNMRRLLITHIGL